MPTVTQTADHTAAQRKRRQRERQRAAAEARAPLLFERADWELFLRPETLPQKAGCEPDEIGRIVLKEITDNALDTRSADVTIEAIPGGYRVTDRGPGIAPADVTRLFAVNRPLLSSKLKRLPLRGMLGNGLRVVMGAVAAFDGTITVTSRGHRLALVIDGVTGETSIASDTPVEPTEGTTVEIALSCFDGSEKESAELALEVARTGTPLQRSKQTGVVCARGSARVVCAGDASDYRGRPHRARRVRFKVRRCPHRGFACADEVAEIHQWLCRLAGGRRVMPIGSISNDKDEYYYAKVDGTAHIGGAVVPFCVECRASCERAERGDNTNNGVGLLLNRSPSVAPLFVSADSDGLFLRGCGFTALATGKRADYALTLSLITPYVRLMNDGKTPFLADFADAIRRAVQKAAGSAYRAMVRPPAKLTIIGAAWLVIAEAYRKASANNTLPANARQIMYAARPRSWV